MSSPKYYSRLSEWGAVVRALASRPLSPWQLTCKSIVIDRTLVEKQQLHRRSGQKGESTVPSPGLRAIFCSTQVGAQLALCCRELSGDQRDCPGLGDGACEGGHHLCILVGASTDLLQ